MQGLSGEAFEMAKSEKLIGKKTMYYSQMVELCLYFKWTPKQYKQQNPNDIAIFSAVLAGKKKYGKIGGLF